MNILKKVFPFLFIFIISCSNNFEIYNNPTKNNATIANNYRDFLRTKLLKSSDKTFKDVVNTKLATLNELNVKLNNLESKYFLRENLSEVIDSILDLEDV